MRISNSNTWYYCFPTTVGWENVCLPEIGRDLGKLGSETSKLKTATFSVLQNPFARLSPWKPFFVSPPPPDISHFFFLQYTTGALAPDRNGNTRGKSCYSVRYRRHHRCYDNSSSISRALGSRVLQSDLVLRSRMLLSNRVLRSRVQR